MEQWLADTLPPGPNGTVIVWRNEDGSEFSAADPAQLASDLAGVTAPPTYAALSASVLTAENWQRCWDWMKAQGLVS